MIDWPALRSGSSFLSVFTGMAKPMPIEPPEDWPPVAIWALMPITLPCPSRSGPPELPGLMAASVWITSAMLKLLGASMVRCTAETMPVVTVRVKPNGLPMAIVGAPTLASDESPSGRTFMSLTSLGSILSTARSEDTSVPMTLASTNVLVFSSKLTETFLAPSTTWALVTMWPWRSTTKPEPVAVPLPPSGWPKGDSPPLSAAADALRAHEDHALALVAVDVGHRAGRVRAAVVDGPVDALGDGGLLGVVALVLAQHAGGDQAAAHGQDDEASEQAGEEVAAAARLGIGRCHDRGSRPPALNGHKWRQP